MSVRIKVKKVQVNRYDLRDNSLELVFTYFEGDKQYAVKKNYSTNENSMLFVKNLLQEIKKSAKVKYNLDNDENFDNIVNIIFDEVEDGDTEDKLIAVMDKLKEKVKGFKKVKSAENYLDKHYEINNLVIDIK
ncbi:MAG TPA: hypothetical protein VJH20_02960 [Candidatus Nanoarchaeia archaeon]|nr:hypothetical protein [Candidatus Nanoarchaeia archaeon]